ncbi:MAG: aminotransferase class V-fold PLP-dependent enzyme, partial [Gammaproteobacteria bacterium]|nr:aminotransferase class V-fold PLP-dependent enzyme [Gammaproteobacteria bacterium]
MNITPAFSHLIETEFPQSEDIIYLNHAGIGPWPKRTADVIKAFAEENLRVGATHYPDWAKTEQELRYNLKTLINAPSVDDIALLKNTSEALSVIAYGIDWKKGDNIVTSNQEFPSNRIVWQSLHNQGVELREAELASQATPEEALFAQVDNKTRMITISAVQFASGLKVDLKRIGQFCHEHNLLFCVDAIQHIGAFPFDVQAIQAHFVMADGHKWMLGPEGLALLYVHPDKRDQLKLYQFGWHMVEHAHDFNNRDWVPAHSARRFECGSPNM